MMKWENGVYESDVLRTIILQAGALILIPFPFVYLKRWQKAAFNGYV
jgi:hypothetical protein